MLKPLHTGKPVNETIFKIAADNIIYRGWNIK